MLQNRDGDPVYPETVYEYEYANTAWQDQLTAIKTYTVDASGVQTLSDTQSFAYDAMGNPTSCLGKTLTWEGKQLTGISATEQSISYAYDENGLRTQKTVDGTTTNYYYNGSLLIGITVGYRVMRFSYDSSGNVVAMDYSTDYGANFTTYYYFRNGQGDIIKLINDNGTVAATYEYDSWGNITSIGGTLPQTLAIYQPFRYRGYVYDTETGWYYLQSRYYDPTTCRFISSDVMLSTGQGVLGHNSYAYCLNNPVNMSDPSGNFCGANMTMETDTGTIKDEAFWDIVYDMICQLFPQYEWEQGFQENYVTYDENEVDASANYCGLEGSLKLTVYDLDVQIGESIFINRIYIHAKSKVFPSKESVKLYLKNGFSELSQLFGVSINFTVTISGESPRKIDPYFANATTALGGFDFMRMKVM